MPKMDNIIPDWKAQCEMAEYRAYRAEAEAAKLREAVTLLERGRNLVVRLEEENAKLRAVADAAAAIGDIRQGPVLKAALAALGDKPHGGVNG